MRLTRRNVHWQRLRVGDPSDRTTDLGQLARGDLRDVLHDQVTRSLDAGASWLCGGTLPAGKGFFYPPTVLACVEPGMAAFEEETFGPVAAEIRAGDVAQAVELANHSQYGLAVSVWTSDVGRAEHLARWLTIEGRATASQTKPSGD